MGAAAATTTPPTNLKSQPTKSKRRRCRNLSTSSSTAATATAATAATTTTAAAGTTSSSAATLRKLTQSYPSAVSPDNSRRPDLDPESGPNSSAVVPPTKHTIQLSRSTPISLSDHMDGKHSPAHATLYDAAYGGSHTPAAAFPSSFSKFNSALTAGLLNPMSPPLQTPTDKAARSSPTLSEIMANEPDYCHPRSTQPQSAIVLATKPAMLSAQDRHCIMQQRVAEILGSRSPGNLLNDSGSSDIRLTLTGNDGFSVTLNVHRQILVSLSRFFAGKLKQQEMSQHRDGGGAGAGAGAVCTVEIAECDDVEVYVETLRLMYCKDLRKQLMKEDVPKVLGILKVSAALGFDASVLSCLEYLEAAPWAEDEEEKVASLLSELRLEGIGTSEVLKRVSVDITASAEENGNGNEEVLMKLLNVVLEGRDEKARREMKGLVYKMLRENALHNDLRKESLYSACNCCLQQLRCQFLRAAAAQEDLQEVGQIAKQADNLQWILDILIDRQIAEEFLKNWASQTEMSSAHSRVPPIHRFEVSRVTARLFVGIGKGQLIASKDARCSLLQTWLVPFYDDFGWMRRASKGGLDRHSIEDGLSNTILTLPLTWQQEILLSWFHRFLNSGDDCPNIQRGFEVWWRRAFWKRNGELDRPQFRISTSDNS
ncbi:hypothetical protein Dimus_008651 [Dionaea muscipula]